MTQDQLKVLLEIKELLELNELIRKMNDGAYQFMKREIDKEIQKKLEFLGYIKHPA